MHWRNLGVVLNEMVVTNLGLARLPVVAVSIESQHCPPRCPYAACMVSPSALLAQEVSRAVVAAYGRDRSDVDPLLRPSQFADLQSNVALALAKDFGAAPRDVARNIADHLDLDEVCDSVEISGPGFINFTLRSSWIARQVSNAGDDLGGQLHAHDRRRVVIDYSAPNVAKEMHVGHLRTTVVGDALARVLEHLGHQVIRQNHVGDWGTPFGMLIEHLVDVGEDTAAAQVVATDPNAFYQAARNKFDNDAAFADRARSRVVLLQARDSRTMALWEQLIGYSHDYFNAVYSRLGVSLRDADLAGESIYNDDLPAVCDELESAGIATISDGALCVFPDGYLGREGNPLPLIVRKSDGGFGYATTDLAAVRHRVRQLKADRLIYVIGSPQALHLRMVWDTARVAGWLPSHVEPVHVSIGNVLGTDRKMLRTRSGSPPRLNDLIDEAIDAAREAMDQDRPDLDESTKEAIAPIIGVGAIKYADLSVAHNSEYVFDLERMVNLHGNTSRYLQYAVARIRSILRAADDEHALASGDVQLFEPAERALGLKLLDFLEVLRDVGHELEPHRLCAYLFELAQAFSVFYEQCPVLNADAALRRSRLTLCVQTRDALTTGLELLGIAVPEVM